MVCSVSRDQARGNAPVIDVGQRCDRRLARLELIAAQDPSMLRRQVRYGREADNAHDNAPIRQLARRIAKVAILRNEDDRIGRRELAELVHDRVV